MLQCTTSLIQLLHLHSLELNFSPKAKLLLCHQKFDGASAARLHFPLSRSPVLHHNDCFNYNLLSAETYCILTCLEGQLLPGLELHFPPLLRSLNCNCVQQSSLLSNQRMPQMSHSLVVTLIIRNGWWALVGRTS